MSTRSTAIALALAGQAETGAGSSFKASEIITLVDVPPARERHDTPMAGDNDPRTRAGSKDADRGRPRKLGILFWLFAACFVSAVTFNAMDGEFLVAAMFSALGIHLLLQHLRLHERSPTYRYGSNASAAVFSALALLLFLKNLGVV